MPSAGYGAHPADGRRGTDAVRQERCRGERVGSAAGPAERQCRSASTWSRTVATSSATFATDRPGRRVDDP